jgi:hypothetical protein
MISSKLINLLPEIDEMVKELSVTVKWDEKMDRYQFLHSANKVWKNLLQRDRHHSKARSFCSASCPCGWPVSVRNMAMMLPHNMCGTITFMYYCVTLLMSFY